MTLIKKKLIIENARPDGDSLSLPYMKIEGSSPKIAIIGTQHGDEFFSIAIINEFIKSKFRTKADITIFPIANPSAFNIANRRSPIDNKDMNRSWPGKKSGTLTSRMCYHIFEKIKNCDYVLDMHNANKNIRDAPQVRVHQLNRDRTQNLCKYLGIDFFINHSDVRHTLVEEMHKLNKTAICVEIGEGKRIDSFYLDKGAEIIQKFIQYAINPSIAQSKAKHIDEETIKKIHASKSGIFTPNEGALGKKTKIIGTFLNISDFSEKKITLKKSCKVLSLCVGGVVSEGELLGRVVE